MIGSFLTRALALVLGYAYPAYECFKTVELNKPEIEQLRFWCQYWILVAALTIFERVGESFISWLPMYSEAKVAFFVYLWYPKTRGTAYVYDTFFRPYVAKHETEIDRNLLELRTRAGDIVILYSQRIVSYVQTRFFEILQYVASQSQSQSSRPQPPQQSQQSKQTRQTVPTTTARQPAVSQPTQQLARPQPPPASPTKNLARPQPPPASPTKNRPQETTKPGVSSSVAAPLAAAAAQPQLSRHTGLPPSVPPAAQSPISQNASLPCSSETASSSTSPGEAEAMQIEVVNGVSNKNANPPQETPMEEAIRVTRGRLRRRAATAGA